MIVQLDEVSLPEFGLPTVEPEIPVATYQARIQAAREAAKAAGYDVLVVYGDKEHFANLSYLTGYDPRFEEALLILSEARDPALVVGVEGWSYSLISKISLNRILYGSFSLMAMPRADKPMLEKILRDEGIGEGSRVGVVGWKYFETFETPTAELWLDTPAFIVDTLREIVGDKSKVVNATALFMNPVDGFRIVNDLDQLAAFEFAATHASQSLRNVFFGLMPGMTEYEAVRLMGLNGMPLNVHPMLSVGERAWWGLPSPSMRVIQLGDALTMAVGFRGGLSARAGFVVREASDLPHDIQDYVDRLVAPYYAAMVAWYERVGIGVTGGELHEIIRSRIGDPFFGVQLNAGHYIHLDEWVHSPVAKDSTISLKSGMALQVDVIPATGSRHFTSNIEDGIALADEGLRADFERKYPEAWGRITARRRFMENKLGIFLKPEVMPFSNIPAYIVPFLLSPHRALRVVR